MDAHHELRSTTIFLMELQPSQSSSCLISVQVGGRWPKITPRQRGSHVQAGAGVGGWVGHSLTMSHDSPHQACHGCGDHKFSEP